VSPGGWWMMDGKLTIKIIKYSKVLIFSKSGRFIVYWKKLERLGYQCLICGD
jgi:hypothetical protein